MLWFVILMGIAIVVYMFLFSDKSKSEKKSEPPTPPTCDVHIIGCNGVCGYFTPEFKKNANGDYEGTRMAYCAYQKATVRQGSKCAFAKDHPDKLGRSVFDDLNL